jgi:membrane fusion protein (multidrug efflux system)
MTESFSSNSQTENAGGPPGGSGRLFGWFLVLFLVLLAFGAYSLLQRRSERRVLAQQTERLAVPHVAVIHAMPINADSEMVIPGTLAPFVQSPIYARTSGYLMKWYKDIGSHVKAGELLAEIDTPEVDQQLEQARADLATAQANLKLSQVTAERYQELFQKQVVAQQDVDTHNGDFQAKDAMVKSAEANLKRLEDLESFKRVYAPFEGVITQRNVDTGTLINSGNGGSLKEMFDLAQTDPIRVYVSVPQTYAPSIRAGLKACLEVTELPGRQFCGRVARTADAIDPATRTLNTEVDVPNPSGTLLQGEFAQVHFDVKLSGQRLTLPINALLFRPEGTMAAVVGPDNRLTLQKLTIGRDLGSSVEVLQGISPQDAVVIDPADSLEQGEMVEVATPDAHGTPPAEQGSR